MRPEPRKKIDLNAPQPQLNQAFARLEIENLSPAPQEEPAHSAAPEPLCKRGRVILRRETAHRGGKTVIVIHDFPAHLSASEIDALARRLRHACGCGGSVKDRCIEMQGDQPAKIRALLEGEGFQVAGVRS